MQRNEENNRMGKTKDLFKTIRDTKGTFHSKRSTIKDKHDMDLTEAKDIKKKWQEYTEEPHKKDLNDPDKSEAWSKPGVAAQIADNRLLKVT